ncbi:MAG TPA: hypothetical protein VF951_07315 [Streptosporangiaceae bacterium]
MQQVGGSVGTALLNTLAASAAASYLIGKNARNSAVLVQAQLHSYATAYRWAAVFFLAGLVVSALMYRSGPERSSPAETVPVSASGKDAGALPGCRSVRFGVAGPAFG